MDSPIQNLHYAIGELAYCMAKVDGKVQKEEREKFHDIVISELKEDYDFNISDIVFHIMEKDKADSVSTYNWAINEIKMNGHYLSPELKSKFINVMKKIANAYPPVTVEERDILKKFKKDIGPIKGDPVFYLKTVR